ncbi:pyridoxal phosphate-dependent aminotransferase [Pendulispora rubella]|uniref:Aminotransferase n=1 Tax=Pendulispora rubella TaxID=2741070 RepID=A0ABZ2LDK0_9BACT
MPQGLAKRLSVIVPSITLQVSARANDLRSRGIDVVNFGVGEPDFEPPAFILDAAKKAIDAGQTSKYTAVTGIAALKQAICAATEKKRGFLPTPDQITVSVGAKHSLFNVALACYEEGDEILIPTPCWVSYPEQVRMFGAEPVLVPTSQENGWRLTPDDLARALTPRTKAVILCTPSNPTGSAYTEEQLSALLEVLRKHDCYIVVDEIYGDLVYDGFRHVSAAKIAPDLLSRLIIIDGVSKSYAMTGWRIGWSIAPKPLAKACDVVQGQSTTNPTAVAQHAAVAALTGPQEEVEAMRGVFQKRRDLIVSALNAIPGVRCRTPEGAFYAFPDCRGLYGIHYKGKPISNDEDLAFFLLEKAHVAAVPGGAFGAPGYLRFSYATSEDRIAKGIASMRAAVEAARQEGQSASAG